MIICRTPFRISFFGGGTDFPRWYKDNGASVISSTIDKYCYINVRYLPKFFKYNYRLRYFKTEQVKTINQIKHPSFREIIKFIDLDNSGLEIVHNADLPALSGLGASSSSTVCLLQALNTLKGKFVTKKMLATDALYIEQKILKEFVGSQDQIATAFGGLNHIRFNNNKSFEVNPIINKNFNLKKLEKSLVLIYTGIQRKASVIEKYKAQNIKQNGKHLHQISEITNEALKYFNGKLDLKEIGKLLKEQWSMKKNLSKKVTNRLIDNMFDDGIGCGAFGAKLLGAGSGGFMLFICDEKSKIKIREKFKNFLFIPIKFETTGSQIIYFSRPDAE